MQEKSLFAQYCEERLNKAVLENEDGFLSYIADKVFYIEDVFIKEDSRGKSNADVLYSDVVSIAKAQGYKEVYGSVLIRAKNAEKSMAMLLARKWKFSHIVGDLIYLKKDI